MTKDLEVLKPVYNRVTKELDEKLNKAITDEEKEELERDVKDVTERWEQLEEKLTERQRVIVEFVPKTEEFDTKRQKFVSWLVDTEKRLKDVPDLKQVTVEEYDQELKVRLRFSS